MGGFCIVCPPQSEVEGTCSALVPFPWIIVHEYCKLEYSLKRIDESNQNLTYTCLCGYPRVVSDFIQFICFIYLFIHSSTDVSSGGSPSVANIVSILFALVATVAAVVLGIYVGSLKKKISERRFCFVYLGAMLLRDSRFSGSSKDLILMFDLIDFLIDKNCLI